MQIRNLLFGSVFFTLLIVVGLSFGRGDSRFFASGDGNESLFAQVSAESPYVVPTMKDMTEGVLLEPGKNYYVKCSPDALRSNGSVPMFNNATVKISPLYVWGYEFSGNEMVNSIVYTNKGQWWDGKFFASPSYEGQTDYHLYNQTQFMKPNAWYRVVPGRLVHFNCFGMFSSVYQCGNGVVEPAQSLSAGGTPVQHPSEECDDGNTVNGDGCSRCRKGDAFPDSFGVCGNKVIEQGETCDDGNAVSGDGCSSLCKKEDSTAALKCGNKVVDQGETCDDGNAINGDGCNTKCQKESVSVSCKRAGCNLELCVSSSTNIVSNCQWKGEYACYKPAECKVQTNGQCGWTPTDTLTLCVNNARKIDQMDSGGGTKTGADTSGGGTKTGADTGGGVKTNTTGGAGTK